MQESGLLGLGNWLLAIPLHLGIVSGLLGGVIRMIH